MVKTRTTECAHCKKILAMTAIKRHIRIYHESGSSVIIQHSLPPSAFSGRDNVQQPDENRSVLRS